MKRSYLFLAGFVLAFLASCDDASPNLASGECTEVRLVAELCNQAVLQVVGTNTGGVELGSIEIDGTVYNNVFKTFFHCQQMPDVDLDGNNFNIRPISKTDWEALIIQPDDCAVCEPLLAGTLPFTHVQILSECVPGVTQ